MRWAGIDIGSRTVKLAVIEGDETVVTRKALMSHDSLQAARRLMKGIVKRQWAIPDWEPLWKFRNLPGIGWVTLKGAYL